MCKCENGKMGKCANVEMGKWENGILLFSFSAGEIMALQEWPQSTRTTVRILPDNNFDLVY